MSRSGKKISFCVLLTLLSLTACGKRPMQIDPPPDVTDDQFPHIYPNPATDPKP